MPGIDPVVFKVIQECQKSPAFFINSFCKVKHPKLGMLPFKLFSYQKKCLSDFVNNKYNIFRKCRQCGASTLTGSFALWYAMFYSNKTVLIVSKRDDDAKEYLARNVKFVYSNLPPWMKELWKPETINEHTIAFSNGSVIRSLTSSPDTLRSNASSLNIIDEAAFIEKMEDMWAGGWSTLQHGGSVIVISTPKGVGNWYWKTWADAIDKQNDFNPIIINWWDMDWKLEYTDELSGVKTTIAPTDSLRLLEEPKEIEKYGPGPEGKTFWSPWLEGEYRNLATKGDDSRFRQEVLAEFIGSGNTVLSRNALAVINSTTADEFMTVGQVDYVSPTNGDRLILDFQDQLRIWKKPYTKRDAEFAVEKAIEEGRDPRSLPLTESRPHNYVLGADPSSGEADDFCAVQVLDIDTQEQVAELKIKALPKIFAKMIDYIGRMYNVAHVVCERTGIGQAVTQELDKDVMYPNLYRHRRTTANLKVKYNQIGYPTTGTTKPQLIKHLLDNIGEDGYVVRSSRLYHEFCIFIHLGNSRYGNEPGTGNTDDLVLATALALEGIQSALMRSGTVLIPLHNIDVGVGSNISDVAGVNKPRNSQMIAPIGVSSEMYTQKMSKNDDIAKFTMQLGGIPLTKDKKGLKGKVDSVTSKKHILKYFRG
jgi:hypothetical protein